jgi:hypothetical protein
MFLFIKGRKYKKYNVLIERKEKIARKLFNYIKVFKKYTKINVVPPN